MSYVHLAGWSIHGTFRRLWWEFLRRTCDIPRRVLVRVKLVGLFDPSHYNILAKRCNCYGLRTRDPSTFRQGEYKYKFLSRKMLLFLSFGGCNSLILHLLVCVHSCNISKFKPNLITSKIIILSNIESGFFAGLYYWEIFWSFSVKSFIILLVLKERRWFFQRVFVESEGAS